ncbi:hypothetical protein BS47DRAFT_176967 [Hydnum rufescens UP504]|uniref:Uncharacterized protein n=1 Tax=Hydnum rufescens UP504 TaxID=1448309 RepID=A0A9P6ANN2_9AGAM|nr:hypothetical protein BS47DRAFT_176967 [Hydnum rufescens UP504]
MALADFWLYLWPSCSSRLDISFSRIGDTPHYSFNDPYQAIDKIERLMHRVLGNSPAAAARVRDQAKDLEYWKIIKTCECLGLCIFCLTAPFLERTIEECWLGVASNCMSLRFQSDNIGSPFCPKKWSDSHDSSAAVCGSFPVVDSDLSASSDKIEEELCTF